MHWLVVALLQDSVWISRWCGCCLLPWVIWSLAKLVTVSVADKNMGGESFHPIGSTTGNPAKRYCPGPAVVKARPNWARRQILASVNVVEWATLTVAATFDWETLLAVAASD
jgi:hypothetical protein